MSVPIFASEDVLNEASILIPGDEEEEVEKFREFLDNVSPEDFEPRLRAETRPAISRRRTSVTQSLCPDMHGADRHVAERARQDVRRGGRSWP